MSVRLMQETQSLDDAVVEIGRTGVDLGPIPRAPTHRSRFALLLTAPNLALALERTSLRGLLVADSRRCLTIPEWRLSLSWLRNQPQT